MDAWVTALGDLFTKNLFIYTIIGTWVGFVIGAIPGLGPVFAVALFIPITFGMDPLAAMIFLTAIYFGTVSGGSVSSILLNIPGTTGSIATCWDGFALAKQGRAAEALGASMTSSIVGGLFGVISLAFLGPVFGRFAAYIGPAEYFSLIVLAFALVAAASKGETLKGMIMAGLGLLLSFVGMDVITATPRYSFNNMFLEDGIPFGPAVIGLFAFSQLISFAITGEAISQSEQIKGKITHGIIAVFKAPITVIRSAILGVIVGVTPGVGINVSNLLNYMVEKNASKKEADMFGKGHIRGIISPEVANNATATGSLATAFALGIPGGSTDAILLGGLMLYGLSPGKAFFDTSVSLFFPTLIWGMLLAPFALIPALALVKLLAKVTQIKQSVLLPLVAVVSILGAIANRGQVFDIWVMIVFGVIGYFLEKGNFSVANLVVAMVLGELLESNLNRALRISDGSYAILFQNPVSVAAYVVSALMIIGVFVDYRKLAARLLQRMNFVNKSQSIGK